MTIRAIFLDMDHTLCDTERADQLGLFDFQLELSKTYGRTHACKIGEQYLRAIYGENRHLAEWQKTPGETEVQYRTKILELAIGQVCQSQEPLSHLTKYAELFMDLRIKHFSFFPGTEKMLLDLRTRFKLVLVSNGPLFSQEPKIAKVSMSKYVDHIILGGSLEYEKPHPSIFQLACQNAQCEPSEAIHVGDKLDSDIKGANDSGITSVWVNSGAYQAAPFPTPDYTIRHICELEALLSELEQSNVSPEPL